MTLRLLPKICPPLIHIQSAYLNGEDYDLSWIEHKDILDGGELRLIWVVSRAVGDNFVATFDVK